MMLKSIYKPDGGKLVRIEVDLLDNSINQIKICGDFFLHPEDGLGMIEANLVGIRMMERDIRMSIKQTVETKRLTLFGITPKDIAKAVMMAR